MMIRPLLFALILGTGLASCTQPPADRFVGGAGRQGGTSLDLGLNTASEPCSLQASGDEADIHCGTYVEPAGRVSRFTQAGGIGEFMATSAWRKRFDGRFLCVDPTPAAVGGTSALVLSCTRRQGGWPHVAVATSFDGTLYVADGIRPVQSVLSQAILVMAERASAVPVDVAERRGLASQRLAARAESAEGAGAFAEAEFQMSRGGLENRRGNYAAAEAAYRAAITIQERVVGRDNPALAVGLARQALQVSNQGRFAEADRLYTRAERLARLPDQIDPVARPLVIHLKALNDLNANRSAQALVLLDEAERGFAAIVPPDVLAPRTQVRQAGRSAIEEMADSAADAAVLANPANADALNGLIESRRYRAIALTALGRTAEAQAALQSARGLYSGRDRRLLARYLRTAGMTASAAGRTAEAVSDLGAAVDAFARAQPNSLPLAETRLLQAAELVAEGNYDAALPLCRSAAETLLSLNTGLAPNMLMACLRAFGAAGQPELGEMFALSQLGQGSITTRQIARATARLAEGARDPRVADAIRLRDRTGQRLDQLYTRRGELTADRDKPRGDQPGGDKPGAGPATVADLDEEIRRAQEAQRDAGQALQAAAPGFAGLVQEAVSLESVRAILAPNEAVAAIVLGEEDGWTFLIRANRVRAGRIEGGAKRVDALVRRIRASMELGPDYRPARFDTEAALALYTAVLGPVAADLDGTTLLTVAPTGSLLSVPFGLLLTGPATEADTSAPFLIRKMAVSHVPSVGGMVNLRRSAKTVLARQPWFGLGDYRPPSARQAAATFPADGCGDSARLLAALSPLPGARRELDAARQVLGADVNDQLLGAAFTAPRVMVAPLKDHRILHFATHAVLPGELRCQAEPAILTSTTPDAPNAISALLTASQIEQMDLDAELVILAACNTAGPGGTGAGESLSGLARSFFFAGARSLLVTHWDANDITTTYLTVLFLNNLRSDPAAGGPAALAAAQLRMLDEATGGRAMLAHPYYWAVGALIGGQAGSLRATGSTTQARRDSGGARL